MLGKLCFFFFILCFCSCGSPDLSVKEDVNRVLKKAELRENLQTKEIQGQKKVFHPIDQQLFEGWIVDYHESGKLLCLEHYERGMAILKVKGFSEMVRKMAYGHYGLRTVKKER